MQCNTNSEPPSISLIQTQTCTHDRSTGLRPPLPAGVLGNEKSTGDGGGAGVSFTLTSELRDEVADEEALNAALTSWPRVELVRRERRWRGLKGAGDGILMFGCVCELVWWWWWWW